MGIVFANRMHVDDLLYQGAFRLPDASNNSTWEYSGLAMTCYPEGDPKGANDGYLGSIFAVGHDHQQHVSEISIPSASMDSAYGSSRKVQYRPGLRSHRQSNPEPSLR